MRSALLLASGGRLPFKPTKKTRKEDSDMFDVINTPVKHSALFRTLVVNGVGGRGESVVISCDYRYRRTMSGSSLESVHPR